MSGVNKAILIGNLGNDPEIKYTAAGAAVANISVATSETWNDKKTGERNEKTEWHRVVFFDRLAEVIGEYLQKGSKIYVEGRIQTRKWETKEGETRYTTEIVGQNMQMLSGKNENQSKNAGDSGAGSEPTAGAKQSDPGVYDEFDDDITF